MFAYKNAYFATIFCLGWWLKFIFSDSYFRIRSTVDRALSPVKTSLYENSEAAFKQASQDLEDIYIPPIPHHPYRPGVGTGRLHPLS